MSIAAVNVNEFSEWPNPFPYRSIIAISEGKFCGGDIFARKLAEAFGIRYVDDSAILEKAGAWGGDRQKMIVALEEPPSLIERITHDTRIQLVLLQAAVADEVRTGNVVCYGAAAGLLSLEAAHVLRVHVECAHPYRLALARKRLALSLQEAEQHLRRCDQAQRRWNSYLFGARLDASLGYDLRIDLGQSSSDEACALVRYTIENQARYVATEAALASAEAFALTARVKAALAANTQTRHLDLAVVADRDSISLRGGVHFDEEIGMVRSVVEKVPGVARVDIKGIWPGSWDHVLGPLSPITPGEEPPASAVLPTAPATASIRAKLLRPRRAFAAAAAVVIAMLLITVQAGFWAEHRGLLGDHGLQKFTGIITDSDCRGKKDVALQTAECTRACVRQKGAKYGLWDGNQLYLLSDQSAGERFAARAVVVSGSLDTKTGTLQVQSINSAPELPPML